MSKAIFEEIARRCSISDALVITGLTLRNARGGEVAPPTDKGTYRSPFRDETKPSFGIFRDKNDQHWCFKDHASGEAGNMINFVKIGRSLESNGEAAKSIDRELSLGLFKTPKPKSACADPDRLKNIKLEKFTALHAQQIASVVGVNGTEGVSRILDHGILGAGTLFRYGRNGPYPEPNCFFLYDRQTKAATTRKLNGEHFGDNKSVAPNDWHKMPIGISSVHPTAVYGEDYEAVFCEGEKDLIAVMHGYSYEKAIPVCMPSATTTTIPEHAAQFNGMTCVIHAQADEPGIKAALQWFKWLEPHAFSICVKVPREAGADWADLASGRTADEMEQLLSANADFDEYIDEEILTLSPDAFQKEKRKPIKAKKKGGSPLDIDNMVRAFKAWESLPEQDRESPAKVCKALGVPTKGPERQRVVRGLANCRKAIHAEPLMRRMGYSVTTAPAACNYSEQVA